MYKVQRSTLEIIFQICAGHSSDRITGIAETTKLRIYNSLALGLAGVFIAALAFVPKGDQLMLAINVTRLQAILHGESC